MSWVKVRNLTHFQLVASLLVVLASFSPSDVYTDAPHSDRSSIQRTGVELYFRGGEKLVVGHHPHAETQMEED